ncbi:Flp family type IVb pilin [Streptomyces sp. AF1B]|uniref:Flp family type IVb pilin n=1 Tax=Streptomyces sp. AF1B TaxID=3399503 RepID=UPI003AAB0A6D
MPAPLSSALVLVHALFGMTIVGGLGLLLTATSADALDGGVLALIAYAAAPGTLGWWLTRRSWEGGARVRKALIAAQLWLILGGAANLAAGSAHGALQLFLPVVILCFLLRPESRRWYETPELDRAERRPFSLARMIRWRRDEGQTAVEYAGLIAIVAAIVTALVVSGLGTQIYGGIQAQVCKVAGMGCAAPAGGDTNVTAGDGNGTDNPARKADGPGGQNPDGKQDGKNGDNPAGKTDDGGKQDGKKDDGKKDDGCFSGIGAFFGCAGDQVKQVGQGLFVDGVWGDVTGIYDMVRHPLDTLSGIADYGKQLGSDWMDNSKSARDKWSKGDYLGAVLGWGGASLKTGGTVLYDTFIGDDVADQWNSGHKTRAVTTVLWNVGSLFIPGYDVGKVGEKLGVLGKLGKLGKFAEKAGKAAEDAKKAAKAGDVKGAEKAAKEADEAADAAEKKARESGCTISAPSRRIPFENGGLSGSPGTGLSGSPGTGTTVLAAGGSPYVVLADDGCDEDAKKEAEEARKQADEADKAADRWQAGDDVAGPAGGKTLRFPNKRHTVGGAGSGQVKERNTVILRGSEDAVRSDIEAIAKGRAKLLPDGNTYEINGRRYGIEESGTVFPKSGPGLVDMDRIEYAALKEIVRNKGDLSKSQQLQRDPKFVNNPDKVAKAKKVYDGTYK